MKSDGADGRWLRRAQPLLGTLVEVGIEAGGPSSEAAFRAAFDALRSVQACLSRFEPGSDLSRFQALAAGESIDVRQDTRDVLGAARRLHLATAGAFDISLGTAPDGWRLEGARLAKLSDAVRLDLGGIGKGFAVDRAVQALEARGCASGWVNAGGDLRAFGHAEVPLRLRDEDRGGVRAFATLRDGAFATSHFGAASRSQLAWGARPARPSHAHVSVAAPLCLWADALTKVVAISQNTDHPLLARHEAVAWQH